MDSNKYTIEQINEDGNVVVTFECDHSTQTLIDAPTDSAEDLQAFISEYLTAYKAGKAIEAVKPSNDVKALIGKPQTADVTEA